MGRHQPVAKTYRRPAKVDWMRNPHRIRYMARELTSVFLIAYALVLLVGVWRLSQGEAAFDGWRAALASPLGILLHLAILVAAVYHTISWFEVMPKTMPDSNIAPAKITRGGWAVAAAASLLVLVVAVGGA